ncbi:MAG TPA: hypothetical protein VJ142_00900 [Candidatus Nanoarchaeia archaeon]|nr:hypothetical protein [Candidatus Nanoarchaeia archaeon]
MFLQWDVLNRPDFFQANLLAGFFFIFLLIIVILYVYVALALMRIAKKTGTKNEWFAFIPIANFYLLTQMAKKSGHWTWALLLGFLPFGGLFVAAVGIWLFWLVAERIKFPGWISLLLIVPFVNLVVLGILAWKK